MTVKVLSIPHLDRMETGESGVHTVVRKYFEHAEKFDIEFVGKKSTSYDLVAAHAGITGSQCQIAHLHGIYFTGDYPATQWQHISNKNIVNAVRYAKIVTVPSLWVQEIFKRDMRFSPKVVPHGVDWDAWQHEEQTMNYVLGYAKNRAGQDVCDPTYLSALARKFPNVPFWSTFYPEAAPENVTVTGVVPYNEMKAMTQRAAVFVQAVKETFGLHALEACAAGVPVVAYNHGGVIDFVEHGVNGYLAEPGNIDDLAAGINYCMKYRHKLGSNGREMAKVWTWENAVQRLSEIYHLAMVGQKPNVAVIIPIYNKQASLERAVNSVLNQQFQPERIILIDDGSTDESEKIGKRLANDHKIVEYHRQNNAGVAEARNNGIRMCDGIKYVCCLDADDAMEAEFLATCIDGLEGDPSLHLAYTKILGINPDGSSGLSIWPNEWDFERQMKPKGNQVPTCCVFRKETFDRLGGYRSRYAPTGCGSEDAALWTQFGIHGYKCGLVTQKPLFVYSLCVGGTSKEGYSEVDYLQLYPSAHDGLHPFGSYKKPVNEIAHPVFMYDEPIISVIIPVGPGHVYKMQDALDSLESQRGFRKWEAIVVNDSGEEIPEHIIKAYPYAFIVSTDGKMGAGYARNLGANLARAKFLVFLDADDMLFPNFMQSVLAAWEQNQSIIYTDYLGSAIISEEEAEKQREIGKLRSWGGPDGLSVIGYPSRPPQIDFDCAMAQAMPRIPLYHWCLVTCLIPTAWHREIGGFDEQMESWEDVDYHWRMAWAGKCYNRVPEELILYRFGSGNRRMAASSDTHEGRQIGRKLLRYIESKKENIEMAGCSGCGSRRSATIKTSVPSPVSRVASVKQAPANDNDFELYYYTSPNRGDHRVIGGHVHPYRINNIDMIRAQGGGFRIDYHYHSGGEPRPFLVHVLDARAQPGHFQRAQTMREAPSIERPEPEEPKPVSAADFAQDTTNNVDPLANLATPKQSSTTPVVPLENFLEDDFDLQTVPGVTASIAKQLDGKTLKDLKAMSEDDWLAIKGVGETKASLITEYLANLEE